MIVMANRAKLGKIDAALAKAQAALSMLMDADVYTPALGLHGVEVWGQIEDLRKKIRKAAQ